ncbi:hypothetical protein [Siminovitchia sp. 179-K 8D1 HS]|uniref:hypothetical protein n=1 Tax=Siminovitchia sp. 179-K 8D1 HS TaxID=3142385 RepID=UPI0039A12F01
MIERQKELAHNNTLYECHSCSKLHRKYQFDLYKELHEKEACPHCEKEISYEEMRWLQITTLAPEYKSIIHHKFTIEKLIQEDKWMETHPDCPKLSAKQFKDIKKTIQTIRKNKEEQAAMDRFMEYNNLKTDLSWVDNLNSSFYKSNIM